MADTKITALTALTAADPANDVIPIVDISDTSMAASGTTKKISINNILACSPSATLASATITGDLTVRTNKLFVNSVGVGIGAAASSYQCEINSGASASTSQFKSTGASVISRFADGTGETGYIGSGISLMSGISRTDFGIASNGALVFGVSTGLAMTLNASGLGVGVSPLGKLHIRQSGAGIQDVGYFENNQAAAADVGARVSLLGTGSVAMAAVESAWNGAASTDAYLSFRTRGSGAVVERLRIDSSGNLGIGVTPSAWASTYKALQVSSVAGLSCASGSAEVLLSNNYFRTVAQDQYITNNFATLYQQVSGSHRFYTAPSGIAGNPITFTERLRLKETGQIRFIPLAADPAGAEAGDVYYNSVSNRLKYYNGTAWTLI